MDKSRDQGRSSTPKKVIDPKTGKSVELGPELAERAIQGHGFQLAEEAEEDANNDDDPSV